MSSGRRLSGVLAVLIADDQPEVRSAMRLVVEQLVGYRVAAEAADVGQLLEAALRTRPDVVLVDWELPTTGAPEAIVGQLRRAGSEARVVAMSARHGARARALSAGADGFVSKCDPPSRLIDALDRLW